MSDNVTAELRSAIMRRIRSKDTKPELLVRQFLHRCGLRYRLYANLPGSPDLIFPKYRVAVFVHGCFWHQHPGCRHSGIPLSNQSYWTPKLARTIARDKRNAAQLEEAGWRVQTIWECEVGPSRLEALRTFITQNASC